MTQAKPTNAKMWASGLEVGSVPMMSVKICNSVGGLNYNEAQANAEFIAEAFNVYHETQLTPRQLLEQRDALLDERNAIYKRLRLMHDLVKEGSVNKDSYEMSCFHDRNDEILSAHEKSISKIEGKND